MCLACDTYLDAVCVCVHSIVGLYSYSNKHSLSMARHRHMASDALSIMLWFEMSPEAAHVWQQTTMDSHCLARWFASGTCTVALCCCKQASYCTRAKVPQWKCSYMLLLLLASRECHVTSGAMVWALCPASGQQHCLTATELSSGCHAWS